MLTEEEVSLIQKQALEMENIGELSSDILDIIYNNGLFKLFVPKELGGKMLSLPEGLRVFEEASRINGSFGWLVTIGAGGGFFVPFIESTVCEQLFFDKKAVIAGSGTASGIAKKVDGGYQVTGKWKYCSGSVHATIFTANCQVQDAESNMEISSFIFQPTQVEIIKDWDAFGLKATGSHLISVEDVFVSDEMTFSIYNHKNHYVDPIYQFPFIPFSEASFAAVVLGIGQHFMEAAKDLAERNKDYWGIERYHLVLEKLAEAKQRVSHSSTEFYQVIEEVWKKHKYGQKLTDSELQNFSLRCKEMSNMILQVAQTLFPYLGMSIVMENSILNQTWRDLHTRRANISFYPHGLSKV